MEAEEPTVSRTGRLREQVVEVVGRAGRGEGRGRRASEVGGQWSGVVEWDGRGGGSREDRDGREERDDGEE